MARVEFLRPSPDSNVTVELDQRVGPLGPELVAQLDGRSIDGRIVTTSEVSGCLLAEGRVVPYYFRDAEPGIVEIWINGRMHRIEAASRGRSRNRAGRAGASGSTASNGAVVAPMPGTVLDVRVAPGEVVKAESVVIVMESMKMEMSLTAGLAGRVDEILCSAGQLVQMNALLMKIVEVKTP